MKNIIKSLISSVVLLISCTSQKKREIVYKTYPRPDGKYKIEVVILSDDKIGNPGGSGDRSGFVRLITSSGEVIQKKDVEMANSIEEPRWNKDEVDIKLFAEWPLR